MKKKQEKYFDDLFWEQKDMVFYTAKKYFKNDSDSEDIVQEVFLKIFLNINKFNKKSSISTWIYRITLNEIFTKFRKDKKHKLNIPLLESITTTKNIVDSFEIKEINENFLKLIKQLPIKRGGVIFLRITQNLTFKEIADILKISADSAKNLFSIGIKKIRKDMEAYCE